MGPDDFEATRQRIIAAAQGQILSHPMLALDEAAAVLQVPAPDVVRQGAVVLSSGGEELVPAFQIDHLGQRVWPVVARINAIFDAARAPWAAASWWLSPSGWLDPGVAPAALVTDTDSDALLVTMAEDLVGL